MNYQEMPVKCRFADRSEKIAAVRAGEAAFSAQLAAVEGRLLSEPDLPAMTLCGPSCSGKTTLCLRLTKSLERAGRHAKLISVDDFFRDREELNRKASHFGGRIDYDSADALDLDCLRRCVAELSQKGETELPVYSLHSGKREGYRRLTRREGDLLIFEGIQTLYPEFIGMMGGLRYLSVFTHVGVGYNAGGFSFSPREIRFIRRIVRDYHHRSSPPAFTFYLWKSVTENEDKNIFPNAGKADLTVNSALPFELSAIRNDLLSILDKIDRESEYYGQGRALAAKFDGIDPIERDLIPENSIFREFIEN